MEAVFDIPGEEVGCTRAKGIDGQRLRHVLRSVKATAERDYQHLSFLHTLIKTIPYRALHR